MADISTLIGAGSLAALGAFFAVIVAVGIAVYIYFAIALMTIAKKTNTKNAWFAWIPILDIYLMLMIAELPGWYLVGLLASFIPVIGNILVTAGMIYLFWKVAEARNKPGWYGILMIVPVVNLIIIGMLAWSD